MLIVAWVVFFALVYKVSLIEIEHNEYDPYSILKIDRGASDSEIKKRYRELSKVMHPDRGGDEEKFKELVKAFKSLTHNETKENLEKYGNPDGPGATHFGIALPKWMVDDKNSIFVLGIYVLIFMIIMPTVVGLWWYKSIKYTSDKVFMNTVILYRAFLIKSPSILAKRALMILASSFEFDRSQNPEMIDRESDSTEIRQLAKDLPHLQEKNREPPLCYPFSIKARALLQAHLSRLELNPNTLLKDKNRMIKKCPFLINEMVSVAAQLVAYSHYAGTPEPKLETIENIMKLSPMIVQAQWDRSRNSLLQLPYIEESDLRHFENKKRNIFNIRQFVETKDADRRSILRYLSDEQYSDIMKICETYPYITMDVRSEVCDDEEQHDITAGALITLTVNMERHSLAVRFDKEGSTDAVPADNDNIDDADQEKEESDVKTRSPQPKKKPKASKNSQSKPRQRVVQKPADKKIEEIKNDSDAEENGDDDDAEKNGENETDNDDKKNLASGRDEEYFDKFQQKLKKREKLETKAKVSHRVFCPHFPDLKQECWWLFVADRKHNQLISAPVYLCSLKDQEEIEIKFSAPKKPGTYSYSVCLRSDSYFDFDTIHPIKLEVKEAKQIEDHPQWDLGEDEAENEGNANAEDDEYETESDEDK